MQIVCLFMVILSSILNRRVIGFRYLPGKSFLSSSLKSKTTKKTTMSTETCAALPIAPVEVFRRDYTPSPFYTSDIFLSFKISPGNSTKILCILMYS